VSLDDQLYRAERVLQDINTDICKLKSRSEDFEDVKKLVIQLKSVTLRSLNFELGLSLLKRLENSE
jgi:hypothetical protein